MSLLRNLGSGLRSLFRKEHANRELDEELRSYFEMDAEEKIRRGMGPREARRAVRLEHGHVNTTKEWVRSAGWESLVDILWQDLRHSLRGLRKNLGFTAIAVLTLALSIAANTTVLSWMSATLLNPIPGVALTSDLVTVDRGDRNGNATPPFSYPDLRDLSERTKTLSGVLGWHDDFMSLTGVAKPERIYGALTTASYFDVLGVHPILGRTFLPEEGTPRAGAAVIVIGYGVWQNHFAGDPQIVGKTIQINRHPYTVIGVAPRDFTGCKTGLRTDLWIPLSMDRDVWGSNRPDYRGAIWLNALGKLRAGVTKNQAEAELNLLMQGIVERFPEDHRDRSNEISLDPLWRSPFGINGYLYKILPMLLGLAGVLLLLACANVASLLLVRSVGRRREIAIRLGMGASRKHIIRQFLIESLLLGLFGGTAATVITVWTSRSLVAFFPPSSLPLTNDAHIDQRVLFATIAVSILAAIISGILPALRSASLPVQSVLKEEATSVSLNLHKSRLLSGLVVAQISFSLVLLVCAGLFTRSLQKAQQLDPGFEASHLLLASYELSPAGYTRATGAAFNRQVLDKLSALPGVESVTLADFSPLSFSIHSDYLQIQGYVPQPHEWMEISRAIVGPNYFHTLRTSLISGREFTEADTRDSQLVAVVNQSFVDRYWPGESAIGKQVTDNGVRFTIVGVARSAKYRLLTSPTEPVIYLPIYQAFRPTQDTTIHLRTTGDPRTIASSVEETIHQLNPELPLFNVNPLSVTMQLGTLFGRVAATFASSFGLLAMLLAAVGIYSVVAYTTRQRTREIGIRVALGAEKGGIYSLVLGQGFRLTLAGLVVGTALALAFTRLLKAQLFGVSETDAITFTSVGLLLAVVALVACHIPARRATRVDPIVALRHE
ncbi:MAG TPA: ABC transporter permease [Candidatus Sulfotelmatobacter sp.]|nr:ABC transporter permease [Candidatus Sulfotelmatobacter sp.]